mmetsp:Transcript_71846/g.142422  ORF Transcript_71846/g.142422 Transcript_71846/m.142422 type:complete len:402 (-) Transcript_71846:90-1295(-)
MLLLARAAASVILTTGACSARHVSIRTLAPAACASILQPRLTLWIDKTLEAERRKRAALDKEAKEATKAERLGQWATLVVANLYRIDERDERVVVEDWENGGQPTELVFKSGEGTPLEQAEAAFKKARRLRRGSTVIKALIEQSEELEIQLEDWRERAAATVPADEDAAGGSDALRTLHAEMIRSAKKLKLKMSGLEMVAETANGAAGEQDARLGRRSGLPRGSRQMTQPAPLAPSATGGWSGREFMSPGGIPILVGRNRKENEHLSLHVARVPDVWFHVRDAPGAHVVLQMSRLSKNQGRDAPPSDACMQMAADLAAFYSELRDERKALVAFTSPKHITKPNGAPLGAVKLRQEDGTVVGQPSGRKSLVPTEIIEARERERFGGGDSGPVMSGGGGKRWS